MGVQWFVGLERNVLGPFEARVGRTGVVRPLGVVQRCRGGRKREGGRGGGEGAMSRKLSRIRRVTLLFFLLLRTATATTGRVPSTISGPFERESSVCIIIPACFAVRLSPSVLPPFSLVLPSLLPILHVNLIALHPVPLLPSRSLIKEEISSALILSSSILASNATDNHRVLKRGQSGVDFKLGTSSRLVSIVL
jgi:hypothetical protein